MVKLVGVEGGVNTMANQRVFMFRSALSLIRLAVCRLTLHLLKDEAYIRII